MVLPIISQGRRAARRLMTATWQIQRATSTDRLENFRPVKEWQTVYQGPGKLQTYEGHERPAKVGAATMVEQRMALHLPADCGYSCQPGDLATCLTSTDPLLVGRQVRIVQAWPVKEHSTAYRIYVDELMEG